MSKPGAFPLRLGFGAASFWCKPSFPEAEATALIHRALERGIRLFDTGPSYGDGLAEERLGRALAGRWDGVTVASKAGSYYDGHKLQQDFSASALARSVEGSCRRLGREQLDLVQLHNPRLSEIDSALDALNALKARGLVSRIGVSSFDARVQARVVIRGGVQAVMTDYNVMQPAHGAVLRQAAALGWWALAAQPLAGGIVSPSLLKPSVRNAWYLLRGFKNYKLGMLNAPRWMAALQEEGWTAAQLALAWVLAEPAVSAAVFNTTRIAHLDALIDAAERPLPDALRARLHLPLQDAA